MMEEEKRNKTCWWRRVQPHEGNWKEKFIDQCGSVMVKKWRIRLWWLFIMTNLEVGITEKRILFFT